MIYKYILLIRGVYVITVVWGGGNRAKRNYSLFSEPQFSGTIRTGGGGGWIAPPLKPLGRILFRKREKT